YAVIAADGRQVVGRVTGYTTRFGADLPEDRFRVPYIGVYAQVEVYVKDLPAFSWQALALQQLTTPKMYADQTAESLISDGRILENNLLKVEISAVDGSLTILDK